MDGVSGHARALERATTGMRNRELQLVTHKKIGVAAIGHAIELARDLKRTSGFASCDVLITGYEKVLAELNAISPTAPPSAESLTSLLARINLFGEFFALLAQLAVVTGSLGRAMLGGRRTQEYRHQPN